MDKDIDDNNEHVPSVKKTSNYPSHALPVQESQTLKPTVCLSQDGIAAGVQTSISFLSGAEHGPKSTSVAAGYLGKT